MAVIAIRGDHVVVVAHQGTSANRHGFLADIEVEKSPHLPAVILLEGLLFEATHAEHLAKETDLRLRAEVFVDRIEGVIGGLCGGFHRVSTDCSGLFSVPFCFAQ